MSSMSLVWRTLFEISEMSDTLSAFTHWIVCFILSFKMMKFKSIIMNMNDFEMLLTFVWKKEGKILFCNTSIFFLNDVVMNLMSSHFNNENWESLLSCWLPILAHFAKHHINFNVSLSLCIYVLKWTLFVSLMILFLWSLYLRYSFQTFKVLCIFHSLCNFDTTLMQYWFQKFFA